MSTLEKPPFSMAELFTLALPHNDEPINARKIIAWIKTVLPYYAHINPGNSALIRDGCHQAELPALQVPTENFVDSDGDWHVVTAEARIYMQTRFGRNATGSFQFLQLPPELRNRIYEMVFQFPPSGLRPFTNMERESESLTITKDFGQPFSMQAWSAPQYGSTRWFYRDWTKDVLNLLLVNKQIFNKAYTYFYHLNTFYFDKADALGNFLQALPASRLQHVTRLGFYYKPWDITSTAGPLRALASLTTLRKLYIEIDETKWRIRHEKGDPVRLEPFDPLKIPGIHALRSMRVLDEVVFSGDCPTITAYLKPEMERKDSETLKRKQHEHITRTQPAQAAKARKIGRD